MTDATGSFERRPPSSRRKVRNGIRLKTADTEAWQGWVTARWLAFVESVIPDEAERATGLDYAREGQTTNLKITSGGVNGEVQGRLTRPYRIRWRIPPLTDEQWRQALDAMAGEAFYAAKLLAHDVPPAFEALLEGQGMRLLPDASEVTVECDCPIGGRCKHTSALAWLVAERLERDPLILLALRGLPGEEVIERLGVRRAQQTRGVATAHAEPLAPPVPQEPLSEMTDAFWRPGTGLTELQQLPPPHHAPHALLRRLGPSPMTGRFPLVGLLASVYDTVAQHAIALRDRAERLDP